MSTIETPAYTEANVVTGMCLWEAFLALSGKSDDDTGTDGANDVDEAEASADEDLSEQADGLLGDHGSFTIRGALTRLIKPCEDAWAVHIDGKDTGEQFDWDWCPRFLRTAMRDGTFEAAIDGEYKA